MWSLGLRRPLPVSPWFLPLLSPVVCSGVLVSEWTRRLLMHPLATPRAYWVPCLRYTLLPRPFHLWRRVFLWSGTLRGGVRPLGVPTLFDCPIAVHPSGSFRQLADFPPHRRSLRLEVKRKGCLKPSLLRAQDLLYRKHKFVRIALKAARSSSSSSSRLHLPGCGSGRGVASAVISPVTARENFSPSKRHLLAPLSSQDILSVHAACGIGVASGPVPGNPGVPPPLGPGGGRP